MAARHCVRQAQSRAGQRGYLLVTTQTYKKRVLSTQGRVSQQYRHEALLPRNRRRRANRRALAPVSDHRAGAQGMNTGNYSSGSQRIAVWFAASVASLLPACVQVGEDGSSPDQADPAGLGTTEQGVSSPAV